MTYTAQLRTRRILYSSSMIVRLPSLVITLLLLGCAGGVFAQVPQGETPADAPPPAVTGRESRGTDEDTVEVTAERIREGTEESGREDAEAEETAEDWTRAWEIGPPNHWLIRPSPTPRRFDADFNPDLPPVNPQTRHRRDGKLRGGLSFTVAPRAWSGSPHTLTRPALGGMTTATGMDQLETGVRLGGTLFHERLDFNLRYEPSWWQGHYRFALDEADQRLDRIAAPWANRDFAKGWRRTDLYSLQLGWALKTDHRLALRLHGAPAEQSGTLRALGRRLSPEDDFDIPTQPAPGGVPVIDPVAGAQGRRRLNDHAFELQYNGPISRHISLEAGAAWHESRSVEAPSPDADTVHYIDNRRPLLYHPRVVNGRAPLTTPAQYRFGGLGYYDGGSESRTLALHLHLRQNFTAAGAHELKYGLQYTDHRVRKNVLNSGPRDDAGRVAFLVIGPNFIGDRDSAARLRAGAYAEISCFGDPTSDDFSANCSNIVYSLVRGPLNPPQPLAARRGWNVFLQDDWTRGRLRLNFGLRYLRVRLDNPVDFSLVSALTGKPLIGPDGFPVGTRDPDNPYESTGGGEPDRPDAPYSPKYAAGPGRFIGGGTRFPAELSPGFGFSWDLDSTGKSRLFFNAARLFDEIPDELTDRAFGNEFGVARANFLNPDFTRQMTGAATYGGMLHSVLPNTRLGYSDQLRAGWVREFGHGIRLEIEGGYRRQGRILAVTQANPLEAIINFQYDALVRLRQCQNCTTYPLFPGYPTGGSYEARGFLAPTLANPGDNTPPGRFGRPSRREASLTLSLRQETTEGGHLSWSATGRFARARGNYEGVMLQTNGTGEEKLATLFDYPLSRLTRSLYAEGPLDPDEPSSVRLHAAWSDLGIRGLSAELGWRWRQGTLRTPVLRSPFSAYTGLIPGIEPDYYRFNLTTRGYTDLWVLRDYKAVERGALGRNPAAESWDLALSYRRPLGHGSLALRLEIRNLFNRTRVLSYEDALEPENGYPDPVSSGPSGESLIPSAFPAGNGAPNPVYGLPATVQLPRQIRLGAEWSF